MIEPLQSKDGAALRAAYKECFGTIAGQKVLRHILKSAGVTDITFSGEEHGLAWCEGRRSLALQIAEAALGQAAMEDEIFNIIQTSKE